jgi:hypothetical protein
MAPFHTPSSGTPGRSSGGRLVMLLRTHAPSRSSVSDEDTLQFSTGHSSNPRTESNNAARSSLHTILSRFRVGRRGANEQPTFAPNPGQTNGGMVEGAPLNSEPEPSRSTQQAPQKSDTETAPQPLSWLVEELASLDTRASPSGSDDDSSSDSIGDDANSYIIQLVSYDDGDTEDPIQRVTLGAYDPDLKQPFFFRGTCDTGTFVNVLSYEKACIVAPHGISDNFASVGKLILNSAIGEVTMLGPIWVEFWLQSEGSHIHYEAPFYVIPDIYPEGGFDALLNRKSLKMMGLM